MILCGDNGGYDGDGRRKSRTTTTTTKRHDKDSEDNGAVSDGECAEVGDYSAGGSNSWKC